MIVADTNTIAYLYLPSDFNDACEQVLTLDSEWVAPILWRSEFRSILAVYMRRGLIKLTDALEIQQQAEVLLNGNEFEVDSFNVLKLANESSCSAYDCEFVYLAQSLGLKLVTADKKILATFSQVAIGPVDFVNIQV